MHLDLSFTRRTVSFVLLVSVCAVSCRHVPPLSPPAPANHAAANLPGAAVDVAPFSAIESPDPGVVRGIVTACIAEAGNGGALMHGFVLQSPNHAADGKPETPDGMFVGMATHWSLASRDGRFEPRLGDELIVRGRPVFLGKRAALVDPFLLRVVRRGVTLDEEVPAFDVRPPDDAVAATAYWAAHAGMRGRVPAGSTVQGFHFADFFNQVSFTSLLRPDHPLNQRADPYARRAFRDAHPLDDVSDQLVDNGNGYLITLADGALKHTARDIGAVLPPCETFDRLSADVTGVVLWTGDLYALHVVAPPVYERGPAPDRNEPPPVQTSRMQLRVATYNLENLYDFRDDPFDASDFYEPAPSGAGSNAVPRLQNYVPASEAEYRARLRGLAAQIVQDLLAPDVLLVEEVEDQDIGYLKDGQLVVDPVNNRDGRLDVLQELAAEIVRAGGPLYASAADRTAADERGIICAYLFRDDRVRLADVAPGHPVLSGVAHTGYAGTTLVNGYAPANPRAVNAMHTGVGKVFERAPQVACFEKVPGADLAFPRGQRLYALVAHFKSRPGDHVALRTEQARLNAAIAQALMADDPQSWIIMGGDLNTFPRPDEPVPTQPADQLGALYEAGLQNLYDTAMRRDPASTYTYVYQGQAGNLDHLFVSTNALARLVDVRQLHINSDYAAALNIPNRRFSDHDPVVAVFEAGE